MYVIIDDIVISPSTVSVISVAQCNINNILHSKKLTHVSDVTRLKFLKNIQKQLIAGKTRYKVYLVHSRAYNILSERKNCLGILIFNLNFIIMYIGPVVYSIFRIQIQLQQLHACDSRINEKEVDFQTLLRKYGRLKCLAKYFLITDGQLISSGDFRNFNRHVCVFRSLCSIVLCFLFFFALYLHLAYDLI